MSFSVRGVGLLVALAACGSPGSSGTSIAAVEPPSTELDASLSHADPEAEQARPAPPDVEVPRPATAEPEPQASPRPAPREVRLFPALDMQAPCPNARLPFTFAGQPRPFHIDDALWLMWFAERAWFYNDAATVAELAALGFEQLASVETRSGMQLYVTASETTVVVGFAGSTEVKDWLVNFTYPQDEGAEYGIAGRVHRGFARTIEEGFAALVEILDQFEARRKVVWLTGHSQGAGQATVAAARLAHLGFDMGPLYLYAAPRVGNTAFAKHSHADLGGQIYRIVNERDLVPRLPPTAAAAGVASQVLPVFEGHGERRFVELDYLHAGQQVWFAKPNDGTWELGEPMDETDDPRYWAEAVDDGMVSMLSQQGTRHHPLQYLCQLHKAWEAACDPRAPR